MFRRSYASITQAPLIETLTLASGDCAGPLITFADLYGSNSAPWQGHFKVLLAPEYATVQP